MMILTASAMKVAERAAVEGGGSYLSLMENAGREAARRIAALTSVQGKKVLVPSGPGGTGFHPFCPGPEAQPPLHGQSGRPLPETGAGLLP